MSLPSPFFEVLGPTLDVWSYTWRAYSCTRHVWQRFLHQVSGQQYCWNFCRICEGKAFLVCAVIDFVSSGDNCHNALSNNDGIFYKSAAGLLPFSHQADIRMRSHRLLRPDDNKSAASCQQAWCKLIFKTFYPQTWLEFFQQPAANLQISSCIKSDFRRLDATWWTQHA